jgi:hypothetical protein
VTTRVSAQEMHALFHMLCTRAVGTPTYSKKDWMRLERLIFGGLDLGESNNE